MTKEQEQVAEDLVERIKHDNENSIGLKQFEQLTGYNHNDVFMASRGLIDMKIIEEFPNKPNSVRLVSPHGKKFTTFKRYRRKKAFIDFPKNYWPVMLIIGIIIGWFTDVGKEYLLPNKKAAQEQLPQSPAIKQGDSLNKQ